jgi:signal transduction histidine kinase
MIFAKPTVRVKLTLISGGLSLLTGIALLTLTYVLLKSSMNEPVFANGLYQSPTGDGEPPAPELAGLSLEDQQQVRSKYAMAEKIQRDLRSDALVSLVTGGGLALGLVTAGGTGLGWIVAGRMLRPLREITSTARRVADTNMHERISMRGPRDELRELADTFDGMLTRLDAAFAGQRHFVANASHELRTPLAINRTLLEVAMGGADASPQLLALGSTLLDVNQRHERLIDALLTLARSEQTVTDAVPLDLAALVRRTAEQFGPQARAADIEMSVDAHVVPVTGDPVLLERLTQNLVQNAIAYNTSNGWVRVATARSGGNATLTVANTGPAVASSEIPSLFEPFRRLTDRVGSETGSGLGLSIVRSVAHAHGGTVAARPRDGGGLTVEVTLPTPSHP